jgi:hypothetical protein
MLAEHHLGHRIEARASELRGRWGFEYRVYDFPKPGRGFRGTSASLEYRHEDEALRAGVDVAREQLETFDSLHRIEAALC